MHCGGVPTEGPSTSEQVGGGPADVHTKRSVGWAIALSEDANDATNINGRAVRRKWFTDISALQRPRLPAPRVVAAYGIHLDRVDRWISESDP